MKTADYWRKRAAILEDAAHHKADLSMQRIERYFKEAELSIRKDIERWYGRLASNNQISLADARKLLTADQLEEFHWDVEKYIAVGETLGLEPEWMKKLENASAKFHISRLEAIETDIRQRIEELNGKQQAELESHLSGVLDEGYHHTAYEVQKGVALGWDLAGLSEARLNALLSKPWTTDQKTFRDRCWQSKTALIDAVHKQLIQGMLRGDPPNRAIEAIRKQFGVARSKAARLVYTETTYFNAVANREAYRDLDVESVEIIETLDSHTCEICQPMDGRIVSMKDYEPGVTVPPFHPNCRGTTAPAIDEKYAAGGERSARDPDGEVYDVPADMTYEQWRKSFVDGGAKNELRRAVESDIIKKDSKEDGGSAVQTVGHIDIERYRCITEGITTDEVIITPERIQHIKERRGDDFLEKYERYFPLILSDPDYIFPDDRPNTAIVCKVIGEGEEAINLILRLVVKGDDPAYKNSILTAIRENKKRFAQRLRNNVPSYRKN